MKNITADEAFELLKRGNERFVNNLRANHDLLQQVNETRDGQSPFAAILSCMDSRTSAELIFDQGLGDIFSIRVAGNVLNDDIVGSMEYAAAVVGIKVIVVLGHTKCGAILGACSDVRLGKLSQLLDKIRPAIDAEIATHENRNADNAEFVLNVTSNNVRYVMNRITQHSAILNELAENGKIRIAGGIYNVESGRVQFFT